MSKFHRATKKLLIAVAGGLVVILGLVMIPYPGPGWLVVFLGLAILATEFVWAEHLLSRARHTYEIWKVWLQRQTLAVRIVFLLITGIVVVMTIWLLNGYGMINNALHLPFDWVSSPFMHK